MDSYTAPTTALSAQPPQEAAPTAPPRSKKPLLFLVGGILIILVIALLAVTVFKNMLFGTPTTKDVTLTYWGLFENKQVMQGLIDDYQQDNPHVTINYEERPLDNHYATVKSRIGASTATNAPDIVRLHSSWVPVLANYLSPIPSTVMTKADYESSFYPVTKDTLLKGQDYIGMPLTIDGLALVYNQDLMNQAGITSVPKTWDDVRQAAAKITKRTDKGVITTAGIAMGTANNVDHLSEIIGLLMAQNGVSITNSQGQVAFATSTSPDGNNLGAEALAFYTLFASNADKVWDESQESSTLAFTKGNVGMILVPSWRVLSLVEQNPQMAIRVTTAPQLAANQNIGYASYWVETVPSISPNKTEAWKFLAWLSQPDQQNRLYADAQQERSLAQPPANLKAASAVSSDLFLAPYLEQAKGYRTSIFASNTGAEELNAAIESALAEAVTSTLDSNTRRYEKAIEALTLAAEKATAVLEKQR